MFPTAISAGALEVLGWTGRLWSSYETYKRGPFLIQIVSTIIGPTPLLAANFVVLGEIIRRLGTQYSRLGPRFYTIIFCSFDVISLAFQAVGGATAASAEYNDRETADRGGNIMLGGIVFQLFTITVYSILASEFFYRLLRNRPIAKSSPADARSPTATPAGGELTTLIKYMVGTLAFTILCLFIRAIYRTIELADGWKGRIITTEVYFNVLDGAMVVLAMIALDFVHLGYFIYRRHVTNKEVLSDTKA